MEENFPNLKKEITMNIQEPYIVLKVLAREIRQQREGKGIQIGKEEVKISLFAEDIILYISDPKNSTRELLILMNKLSAVSGYKINSNKALAFVFTKDKQDEKEMRETTPFTIVVDSCAASNRMCAMSNRHYKMALASTAPN